MTTGGTDLPTSTLPTGPRPVPTSYQHEAFLYRGDDGFLAVAVPFVRDAAAHRQPVMAAVPNPRLDKLRAALGPDAGNVTLVDMSDVGRNPARIIPAWREFIDEHGGPGRPVRGIGEPIWRGRRSAEVAECQLHEALLNLAVEPDLPFWLLCPYDAQALTADVLDELLHSHPTVREDAGYRGSPAYAGACHVEQMFTAGLPEPPVAATVLPFGTYDVVELRHLVTRAARRAGVDPCRADELAVAVTEVATNSVRHGGGGGTLRVWQDTDAFVCEVRDDGRVHDPLIGRRVPQLTDEGGRGVWLANQLCDLVQLRSGARGTTVRLTTWT